MYLPIIAFMLIISLLVFLALVGFASECDEGSFFWPFAIIFPFIISWMTLIAIDHFQYKSSKEISIEKYISFTQDSVDAITMDHRFLNLNEYFGKDIEPNTTINKITETHSGLFGDNQYTDVTYEIEKCDGE